MRLLVRMQTTVGLVLALLTAHADAFPYLMLKNRSPKCFRLTVAPRTTLILRYHAPDLIPDEKTDQVEDKEKDPNSSAGMNSLFERRFKQKLTDVSTKMTSMNVQITPRDASGAMVSSRDYPDRDLPSKVRESIENESGVFLYETKDLPDLSQLEVCFQSYHATKNDPSRIQFLFLDQSDYLTDDGTTLSEQELRQQFANMEQERALVEEHSSRITTELTRLSRRANLVAGDAEFSQAREAQFHERSVQLNRAVNVWSCVRIGVLVVAGYLQVSQVLQFLRSKRIY